MYILHINYDKSDGTRVCRASDEYALIDFYFLVYRAATDPS